MKTERLSVVSVQMIFFFNDTATTEIYTLSLHDALPISAPRRWARHRRGARPPDRAAAAHHRSRDADGPPAPGVGGGQPHRDRKSTRLNSSHANISYAVFCLKKNKCRYLPLTSALITS